MSDTVMNFRIDKDMKKAFEMAAKSRDLTASQMLRRFVAHEVSEYMKRSNQLEMLAKSENGSEKGNVKWKAK